MEKQFVCTPDYPVVETENGKLRGYLFDGVFRFYGVKYAEAKRFQTPEPVEPWTGVRDAHAFGFSCPSNIFPRRLPVSELSEPHRYWPESEHCQYLNIWTGSIAPDAGKAVMVWLHPGAYLDGSGISMSATDGDHLVQNEDVVVVSINHRLNVFGFLDLSPFGSAFENSANVGLADIVFALSWIRRNIRAFGGDPDRVMLFGQSGGGGKVSALLQVPAAEGLFHRAFVMSGIIPDDDILVKTTAPAELIANEIIEELGPAATLTELRSAPESILIRAADRAQVRILNQGYSLGWGPRKNDWYLGSLCLNSCTEFSKKIPMVVGTAFAEFYYNQLRGDKSLLSSAEQDRIGGEKFGSLSAEYMRLFREAYPDINGAYAAYVEVFFRKPTMDYVLKKAALSEAPVYNYLFAPERPMNGGMIATHCGDIPFVFGNAEMIPGWQIPGVSGRLSKEFSRMAACFAKTGNPNIPEIPKWKPCTGKTIETMVIGSNWTPRSNHDRELVSFIEEHSPKHVPGFQHNYEPATVWNY